MHRFVLTDAQWAKMEPLCLGKPTDPGRSGGDNRLFLEAVLWIARQAAGVTVYLPKPITSGLNVKGRFGKQDFVYVAADDVYRCPAGEQLTYHYTNEKEGKILRRYWTTACQT